MRSSCATQQALHIVPLEAQHLLTIERQPSQRELLGLDASLTEEQAEMHAAQRLSRAALADGRVLCCFGIIESFPGRHGLAWAIFAPGLGAHHVGITRAARALVETSGLARIEAIAACEDPDVRSPEMRWCELVGLERAHVLRKFGGNSATCILYERIR